VPSVQPLAYRIGDPRLPWTRLTFYRWEKLGLIRLSRVGGKTMIRSETVKALLDGKIAVPQHAFRKHRPDPKPPRQARQRKAK
jgi:hypothetical protein